MRRSLNGDALLTGCDCYTSHRSRAQGIGTFQMTGGSIIALIGAALALLGPLFLPFISVEEEGVAFASYEILSGQLSIVLALATLVVVAVLLKRRKQSLGWVIALMSVVQLGLMAWTYSNVWSLTPCTAAGLGMCDSKSGGLLYQSLVTLDWGLALVVVASVVAVFGGLIAVAAHPEYERGQRFLRVMMSWQGTIIYEKVFFTPAPVTVGESDQALFQLAAAGMPQHTLLTPSGPDSYILEVPRGLGGKLNVGGQERNAADVQSVLLGRGDTGQLSFENDVDLTFHFTGAESALLGGSAQRESASLAVSFSVVAAALLMLLTTALLGAKDRTRVGVQEPAFDRSTAYVELSLQDLVEPVEPPPLEGLEEDTSSAKAPEEEGRLGDPEVDPKKPSKVPKIDAEMVAKIDLNDIDVTKTGLPAILDALHMENGALKTVFSDDSAVMKSRLGTVAMTGDGRELQIGHGPGGLGFRGIGTGGGGTGELGRIHGNAKIDTGGGHGRKTNVGVGRKKRKSVPTIRIHKGKASGGCDRGTIARDVKRRAAGLRSCYEMQLLNHPSLSGKVTAQWTINTEGLVQGEKLVYNSLKNDAVTDCVMRTLRRIRFKKPEAGVCVIEWPFVFASGS